MGKVMGDPLIQDRKGQERNNNSIFFPTNVMYFYTTIEKK